jgi:DNA-directed RNA polymerase specialized sigma24 family protein
VLLAAGVGIGLGDGDEFDDVGCSVAQKPEGGKACRGKAEMLTRLRVASARQEGETLPSEAAETSRAEESGDSEEPSLSLAAKVFELLTALDPDSRLRKAPPIKVFLLRFRQNLSRAEIGRICHCDKSLVGVRLKTIQDKLP